MTNMIIANTNRTIGNMIASKHAHNHPIFLWKQMDTIAEAIHNDKNN